LSLCVTAENIDWNLPFLQGVGLFGGKFQAEGDVTSHQPSLYTVRQASECLTTSPPTVFTQQKLCSRLSLRQIHYYTEKGHFAF